MKKPEETCEIDGRLWHSEIIFRQLAPCTFHSHNILRTPVQNRRSVELVNHLPSPHVHPYAALRLVFGPWQHWQHLWLPPEQGS